MVQTYHYILYTGMGRVETCTQKTINATLSEQSKYQKSLKETKSIPLTHKYMTSDL